MHYKLWIGGAWQETGDTKKVISPYSSETIALCEQARKEEVEVAISGAVKSFLEFRQTSRYVRSVLLQKISQGIEIRREEFVRSIVQEAGKPITMANVEVNRAISCFVTASEEAKRYAGDYIPMDADNMGVSFDSMVSFFVPRGIVLGISPFNFPLNLIVHKVAPALAIGACIILKPSPEAPGAACLLAEVFREAATYVSEAIGNIPLSVFQVVHCSNELASSMVEDKRIAILSFTGSDLVGWKLQTLARGKKVSLELGGNAAVVVHKDADLRRAVSRSVYGAFSYAGQVCISVQRIFVHREIYLAFKSAFLEEVDAISVGDPFEEDTVVGPLIHRNARDRILAWIKEARELGASVLNSVNAVENILYPVVMESVPFDAKVSSEEVFGPVVILELYDDFSEAISKVNQSRFGLQVGVFTDSDKIMRQATDGLEVGAILFNEIPSFRVDHMPYGGVKDSGLGREGIRFAMEEFSERKTIIKWRNKSGDE